MDGQTCDSPSKGATREENENNHPNRLPGLRVVIFFFLTEWTRSTLQM